MYLLQLNIYKTYSDSLTIHKLLTGVIGATNIEVRQSLHSCTVSYQFLDVFGDFLLCPSSSSNYILVIRLDTTRTTVLII